MMPRYLDFVAVGIAALGVMRWEWRPIQFAWALVGLSLVLKVGELTLKVGELIRGEDDA